MGNISNYLRSYKNFLFPKNYSTRTRQIYTYAIIKFFNYVKEHKNNLNTHQEYATSYILYKRSQNLCWSTINVDYSALIILFNNVLNKQWNYKMTPRPRLKKKLPNILSIEQVTDICNSLDNVKHQTIVIILYATGLRTSELLNLKIDNICLDRLQLKVVQGKGNKDRMISFSPLLASLIKGYVSIYMPESYLIYSKRKDQKYSKSIISLIIKKAVSKAGIKKNVTAQMFRHSYATHHLNFGTDIIYLKNQLGHVGLNVTARYLHLCPHRAHHINHPLDQLEIHFRMPLL